MVEQKKKKIDDFFGLDKSTVALGASALSLLIGVGMVDPHVTQFLKNLTQMQMQQTPPPTPPPPVEQPPPPPEQPEQDQLSAIEEGQSSKREFIDEIDPFGNKISVPIIKREAGQSIKTNDLNRVNVGDG